MVIGEVRQENRSEMNEESDGSECTDDSDDDPSFDVLEETRSALSKISLKKTRSSRREKDVDADLGSESEMEAMGDEIPKLDEKDEKCFEKVEELIKGGHFEKLKLDQCKIYLRKYDLRLTGNKGVLISRIREHQEIKDGCGEKKYPPESFLFNCKGDACLGDVVIFEQNVYEMFSIASRSATGPPCGTRTVVGRIVKESYGAAKQQHTFTIEVLWSKGVKPLQPLQQLLIKGRNLYRIKTMRQRWVDEGKRWKSLQEKHARGSSARYSREIRLQEKENRKKGMAIKRKDKNGHRIPANKENQHQINPQIADVLRNKFGNNEEHKYEQEMRSNVTRVASIQQIVNESSVLQQPSQSILREAKIVEHSIFSAYARKSCENDFRGAHAHGGTLHQKPWNVEYAKHHGSKHYHHHHHAKPRGFYQPRDHQHQYKVKSNEFQEHHHFSHHMHQTSWEKHCTQIPPQQQHSERQRQQCNSQNRGW